MQGFGEMEHDFKLWQTLRKDLATEDARVDPRKKSIQPLANLQSGFGNQRHRAW